MKKYHSVTVCLVVFVIEVTTGLTCHRAEYLIGQECCPMCPAGTRVNKHCTEFRSTSCIPCDSWTYMDVPSGRTECLRCRSCDSGSGLRVKVPCSSLSNAVCESEEGHFCAELSDERSCELSRKHSLCRPGEYVQTPGSSSADTVCSPCPSGSFSNGTLSVCRTHTRCEEKDKVTVKEGTPQSDAECGERDSKALAIGISVVVLFLSVGAAVLIFIIKKNRIRSKSFSHHQQKKKKEKTIWRNGTGQQQDQEDATLHV